MDKEKAEKENTEASVKQGSNPTAEIIQSETERTTAPAPEFKAVSDTVYVKTNGGSVRVRSSCDTSWERATAKFLLAHNRILSGSVFPAQFIKSVIL